MREDASGVALHLPRTRELPGRSVARARQADPGSFFWDAAQVAPRRRAISTSASKEGLNRIRSLLGDATWLLGMVSGRASRERSSPAVINSSLIVALMQARSGRPVKSFAIGFDEKRYDETTYARAVAKHLGTEHTEAAVRPTTPSAFIPQLPVLVRRARRDPLADPGDDAVSPLARTRGRRWRCRVTAATSCSADTRATSSRVRSIATPEACRGGCAG